MTISRKDQRPLVRPKWRPSLAMIVFAVLTTVLVLPLVGLFFFRLYENQLIRQTEAELIAQSAVFSAVLAREIESSASSRSAPPAPATSIDPDPPVPEPILDLATSPILGPRPDGRTPDAPSDSTLLAIGGRLQSIVADARRMTQSGIEVLDAHGIVIAGTADVGLSLAHVGEVAGALQGHYQSVLRLRAPNRPAPPLYSLSRGTNVRVFAAIPVLVHGDVVGAIYASRTPSNLIKHLYSERGKVAAAAAAIIAATLIIGFLFWRTVTRPIHELIAHTKDVGMGNGAAIRPLSHHGTRELALLTQSFLDMATRLSERTDYIATFAAHVSHELKSPLSAIRGAAELLRESGDEMSDQERRKFLDNVVDDAKRLTALVERLRDLARADNPQTGGSTTLAPVIAALQAGFPGLSVTAEGPLQQPIQMSADNALIVFGHLADNAARHNATSVRIEARRAADTVVVIVTNDGDSISEKNRENIFTPFFTTRRETGGTGMGLEIVRSMLRAHRGSIRLLRTDRGVAFEITVSADRA